MTVCVCVKQVVCIVRATIFFPLGNFPVGSELLVKLNEYLRVIEKQNLVIHSLTFLSCLHLNITDSSLCVTFR